MEYSMNYAKEQACPPLNYPISQNYMGGFTSEDVFGCAQQLSNQMYGTAPNEVKLENNWISFTTSQTSTSNFSQNQQIGCGFNGFGYGQGFSSGVKGSIDFGNQYLISNGCEADEYREYDNLTDKRITKSDMNLEHLKEFEYDTEMRKVDGEDKPQTIYICKFDNCNKEFNRTWNILDHARMHKGVKPYKCDFCLKQFTQKGNLRKHLKIHLIPSIDQRKRYKCEFCESSYTERYNYKTHMKKHHLASIRK